MIKMKTIMTAAMIAGVAFTAQASQENPDQPRTVINCVHGDDLQIVLKQHFPVQLDPAAEDGPKGDFYALPNVIRKLIDEQSLIDDKSSLQSSMASMEMLPAPQGILENRVNELFNQLHNYAQNNSTDRHHICFEGKHVKLKNGNTAYIAFTFDQSACQFPFGPGYMNRPALAELLGYVNAMVHKAFENKDYAILGLQAARLILNSSGFYKVKEPMEILRRFYTLSEIAIPEKIRGPYDPQSSHKIYDLKPSVASALEEICQQLLIKENGNEMSDIIHSTIAALRMDKFPRTIEDVRFAVNELTQIQYHHYFSRIPYNGLDKRHVDQICSELINGAPQLLIHLGPGEVKNISRSEGIQRTKEEKISDFRLLRRLLKHIVENLCINSDEIRGMNSIELIRNNLPAFLNDKQAELFIEYGDLERHFK